MREFFTNKRITILAIISASGLILGRLTVRIIINLLVGGSVFGGNFL